MVRADLVVCLKNGSDRRPGGLNRILSGEERSVPGHGVAKEQRVRQLLARLFFDQIEFSLVADELLAAALDASGEGNGGIRRMTARSSSKTRIGVSRSRAGLPSFVSNRSSS